MNPFLASRSTKVEVLYQICSSIPPINPMSSSFPFPVPWLSESGYPSLPHLPKIRELSSFHASIYRSAELPNPSSFHLPFIPFVTSPDILVYKVPNSPDVAKPSPGMHLGIIMTGPLQPCRLTCITNSMVSPGSPESWPTLADARQSQHVLGRYQTWGCGEKVDEKFTLPLYHALRPN